GRDTVDADARAELDGELADEADDRVLRGGIEGAAAARVRAGDRGRQHDRSPGPGELRKGGRDAKEDALDVDAEQFVRRYGKPLLREVGERRVDVEHPGIAD